MTLAFLFSPLAAAIAFKLERFKDKIESKDYTTLNTILIVLLSLTLAFLVILSFPFVLSKTIFEDF
jgi:hypothetical protein